MECFGHPDQMKGGAVADAALDTAHVGTADARNVGERFLRHLALKAKLPNPPSQFPEDGIPGGKMAGTRHRGAW